MPSAASRQKDGERDERADHEDLAMGEVDHADDAVDHRVADGDQAVDRPEGDPVDQLLQKIFHEPPVFRCLLNAFMGVERWDLSGTPRREA